MTHLFPVEMNEHDYENIRRRLEEYHNQLKAIRFANVEHLHNFYKLHSRIPDCRSNDSAERTLAYLFKKLQNPQNAKILEREISLLKSISPQLYSAYFTSTFM
jgi:hypothetical protein